jgi:hypothetical protein
MTFDLVGSWSFRQRRDLRRFAGTFSDLADPDAMFQAWQ